MKKKWWVIILAFLLFTTACQPQDDVQDETAGDEQMGAYSAYEEASPNAIANHLAQLSTKVPDVDRATAIVIGPYALVGINVKGEINQSDVGSIKYQVAETLADDPYGATAAVTADPDIINRIEEMRVEMGQGRPIAAIANELGAIIGRVIPVVPGYEHRQVEDPTDINDDRMSPGDQGELEEIQNEQSKGEMNKNQGRNNNNREDRNQREGNN